MVDFGDVGMVELEVDSALLLSEVDGEVRARDLVLLDGLDDDVL